MTPWPRTRVILALILVYTIIVLRAAFVSFNDEDSRHFIRGDFYSDRNTFSAAQYWRDHGAWSSHLRPMHNYDPASGHADVYTHYPALPDLLTYWGGRTFGFEEWQLRVLPILLSLFLPLLWMRILQFYPMSNDDRWISLFLILCSSSFIFWADNFHKHLHEYLVGALWVILLHNLHIRQQRSALWWFGLPLALWTSNASFESIVFAVGLVVGSSFYWNHGWRKIFDPLNVFLAGSFIAGFLIHVGLNASEFGSWTSAWTDLASSATTRLGTSGDDSLTLAKMATLPFHLLNRLERYFFIPGWAMLFLGIWALKDLRAKDQRLYIFTIIILCASGLWYLVMPQHAYVHHFTAKHFLLPMLILSWPGLIILREKLQTKHWTKWLYRALTVYIVVMAITQQILPVWWKFSLAPTIAAISSGQIR